MLTRHRSLLLIAAMTLSNLFWIRGTGEGFNDKAHELLSARAVEVDPVTQTSPSNLDAFLKSTLGFEFPQGVDTPLPGGRNGRVKGWIQFGSTREDAGLRVRNHFHNPRLAWNQAGIGLPFTESSIVWAQDPNQLSTDKRSWQDARNYYFQALTATSDSERKRLYAETFRTLGHQIHHVQDAAAPAHTRNDWHLCVDRPVFCPDPDEFHFWGERPAGQTAIGASNPAAFNTGLLNQSSPNSNAPIPIARIIDFNDGDIGTQALTPGIMMGLAEYSSANFFSDDTINSPNFLSPRANQVEVGPPEDDFSTPPKQKLYVYFKAGVGATSYPLALASAMLPYVIDPLATPTENGLDDKVFQGYGAKLFPRAIGYSAGLIDYFFRGTINTQPSTPDIHYPPSSPPSTLQLFAVNVTPGEQTGTGTLRLVLRFNQSASTGDSFPAILVSNSLSATLPNQDSALLSFQFPGPLPFPSNVGGIAYYDAILVYTGVLGLENDAVVATNICAGYQFWRWREFPPPNGSGEEVLSLYGGCPG